MTMHAANAPTAPPPEATATPIPAGPSSSPSLSPSRLPRARRWGTRVKLGIALGVVVVFAGLAAGAWSLLRGYAAPRRDLIYHPVQYEKLRLTIVERGTLESAENRDVVCRVKAKTQGGTVASTIKWVIDDGSVVEKGRVLVKLDDSGLQEQLKTQKITRDQANSAAIQADENYKSCFNNVAVRGY